MDKYQFVRRPEALAGTVLHAAGDVVTNAAIQDIDEDSVCARGELEGIHRECRFSDMARHPIVTMCPNMSHSPDHVYLVFASTGIHSRLVDRALAATCHGVHKGKFVRRFVTLAGSVLLATSGEVTNVAIQAIGDNAVCPRRNLHQVPRNLM